MALEVTKNRIKHPNRGAFFMSKYHIFVHSGGEIRVNRQLAKTLKEIEANDLNYDVRYKLVLRALHLASEAGYKCGLRMDPSEPKWPTVKIELPTGQVSWHMPEYPEAWDGHTTEEKYKRINEYVNDVNSIVYPE